MTTTRSTELLRIAEREAFGATANAHATLRERAQMAMRLDAIELEMVFAHLQTAPVLVGLQQQGGGLVARAQALLQELDTRLDRLQQCLPTPPRTAMMGRSWMAEITRIDEMIDTARTLLDLPSWRGTAAEAHLAVVPQQIEAMEVLRAQAVTASESVIAVGALQNTIFEACTLLMMSTAMQVDVQQPGAHVPEVLYRRTGALLELLDRLLVEVDKQITGEGTWLESAQQLSRGMEEASTGHGFEWPRAVRGGRHGGPRRDDEVEDLDETPALTDDVGGADATVDEVPTHIGGDTAEEEDPMLVDDSPAVELGTDVPDEATATPGPPAEADPEPAETSPFEADPAPTPEPGFVPDPEPAPQPGPQPVPDVPTPSPGAPAASLPTEYPPEDEPEPEPEPDPEPVPEPQLTPTDDPTPPAPPPTDVVTDEAWEQIARDRALAEEALFPPPVHREPVGINGREAAQLLR